MILGQLRMGARQAKNAPLNDHHNNQDDDQYDYHNNQDNDLYDHHKPVIEKERLGSRLQLEPFTVTHSTPLSVVIVIRIVIIVTTSML